MGARSLVSWIKPQFWEHSLLTGNFSNFRWMFITALHFSFVVISEVDFGQSNSPELTWVLVWQLKLSGQDLYFQECLSVSLDSCDSVGWALEEFGFWLKKIQACDFMSPLWYTGFWSLLMLPFYWMAVRKPNKIKSGNCPADRGLAICSFSRLTSYYCSAFFFHVLP